MKVITTINDETFEVDLMVDPNREGEFIATIGGKEIKLNLAARKPGNMTLSVDGAIGYYEFYEDKGRTVESVYNCRSYQTSVRNPQHDQLEKLLEEFGANLGGSTDTTVSAPMPGKILGLSVKEGDTVETGQIVLVLEAMKMENEIACTMDGVVRKVHVKVNDTVNADDVLLDVEPTGK